MRFADIPPYTPDGSYQIDVPLSHLERQLAEYQNNYQLDLDIDFQRGHVWTPDQQSAFVEHLLRRGKGSELIRFNRPGWPRQQDRIADPMVLVDGKQRLTAVLAFLRDQRPAFGHYRRQYTDQLPLTAGTLRFMVNNLPTRAAVLQWYLEINAGGTPHTPAELDKVRQLLQMEKEKEKQGR